MITSNDTTGQMTVGLDVSDKYVQACFLDHHVRMALAHHLPRSALASTATRS